MSEESSEASEAQYAEMIINNKIKDCSFCGSMNSAVSRDHRKMFYNECLDCGSRGPLSSSDLGAALHWNRRKP